MSEQEHPTMSWEPMQDGAAFYRRQQLYSVPGKLPDLSDYIVAGAQYGGPLALMRDNTKMIALGRATPAFAKAQIQVYSPAGEGLLAFNWEQSKMIKFGWTDDERLMVLNEEGTYRIYDLQGQYEQHSLGNEAGETGVIDARIHGSGFVALTGSLSLLEVKGWQGGRPLTLASPGLTEPPRSWSLIPPDLTISRHILVLLSVGNTIIAVDSLEAVDQRISRGPFSHIAPSPNGKSLALLPASSPLSLWVVSTDFQRSLADIDLESEAQVNGDVCQVEWCGNDAILVTWSSVAILVGPFGDKLRYFYFGATFAITEPDGVRVQGPDTCDLIQKVPASSVVIFRPGSTAPAAILYDAWESFTRRSPKANERIRSIRPELASAVDACIDAAGAEWSPYWQRRLLNAAKYGRGFLDLFNPTDFINMGQSLKVLNAIRFYKVGIPMSYFQYSLAAPSQLISRLTSRTEHLLALRIAEFLSIPPGAVLRHWARAKIAKGGDDADVCKLIVEKFDAAGTGADVSYAEVARKAWEVGRRELATQLLDYEKQASDQVPLLLSMQEDKLALIKAVDSGDTDLVYHVLLHLHKRLPLGDFFRLIEDGGASLAPASALLQVYARAQNREMLRDFYYSDDRRVESAILALEEANGMKDQTSRINAVKSAQKHFSEDKDRTFEAKMMDESSRLLTAQQQLEKEADGKITFFGLSVDETIRACITNGMSKRADKIRADFKVPDKRFWYVKLRALTAIRDWTALEEFARSKRSPIGYESFVRHLVHAGHPKEAASYVPRCDSPKRVDLYVECGDWRAAGKECKERGDKARLEELKKSCPNSLIARELEGILVSMSKR